MLKKRGTRKTQKIVSFLSKCSLGLLSVDEVIGWVEVPPEEERESGKKLNPVPSLNYSLGYPPENENQKRDCIVFGAVGMTGMVN
jgi:hypothetical protein